MISLHRNESWTTFSDPELRKYDYLGAVKDSEHEMEMEREMEMEKEGDPGKKGTDSDI